MAIAIEVRQRTIDQETPVMLMLARIGGRQQVSPEILATAPTGLGAEVVNFVVARPKLDRYADGQVTAEQGALLYEENHVFPELRAFVSGIMLAPSLRDGRHYAVQWRVGEEDYAFLSACFYKDEWYIHTGTSSESWSKSWGGEEWYFVGTQPVNMDHLF